MNSRTIRRLQRRDARLARRAGLPAPRPLTVGDLLTPAEMKAAAGAFDFDMEPKRAATADVQAREAAERHAREAEHAAAVATAQAERERASAADELAKLQASTSAAHARIDRLSEEQRVERHRRAQDERETGK